MEKYFVLFMYLAFIGCNYKQNNNSVDFTIEGMFMNNNTINKEFGNKYRYSNGFVTISNNLDSIIYIPTDSSNNYVPPCFYNFPDKQGKESKGENNIHAVILRQGYVKIMPKTSKRFLTAIPFVPISLNPYMQMLLTYVYTTKYQELISSWSFIKKKFEYNSKYEFKSLKK